MKFESGGKGTKARNKSDRDRGQLNWDLRKTRNDRKSLRSPCLSFTRLTLMDAESVENKLQIVFHCEIKC